MKQTYKTNQRISAFALMLSVLLTPMTALAEEIDTSKAFEFNCVVSAYYSPLENQENYATGSYHDDIRLNGNGTNGADGTPVYLGMIAAPPEFPFGTAINIDGFGVGEVHDRGGAIKENRIDLWMGWGDEGLARALNWGKRTTTCTAYFPGVAMDAEVQNIQGQFNMPSAHMPASTPKNNSVGKNLHIGHEGDEVQELQEQLHAQGYLQKTPNGVFDAETEEAVISFQKDMKIISGVDSYGAGYVGYLTWSALKTGQPANVVSLVSSDSTILSVGDSGDDVSTLQKTLKDLGYFDYPVVTGYYGPATEEAVYKFQIANNVVSSETDPGAGQFGPVTRGILYENKETTSSPVSSTVLSAGDEGGAVYELQEKLDKAGFFSYPELTGYYGQATSEAVYNFQVSTGVVRSWEDIGAGEFGPVTKARLDLYLSDMLLVNPQVATSHAPATQKVFINTEHATSYRYYFERNLDYGDTGEDVLALQERLSELGYDTPGFYGFATKEAVLQFQIDHGIVTSEEDQGAGVLGPSTRAILNNL